MSILITGGCGFIGSNFVRRYASLYDDRIMVLDALTYAANKQNIEGTGAILAVGNIASREFVEPILRNFRPKTIVNFAAESHVDNSIRDSKPFVFSNVLGTVNLLDCVLAVDPSIRFVHVSTDEVYGSLSSSDPAFTETTAYDPRSPYSASKAASDHFVMAYHHTHGLDTVITNCSNNYGAYQHAEKFVPTVIRRALRNESIPVYGKGTNIRDWLYVEDHCQAIIDVIERGRTGHKYNIGGGCQVNNLYLANLIVDMCRSASKIEFVTDRKGHDFRYDVSYDKIHLELGWKPTTSLIPGMEKTIQWYRQNMEWLELCRPSASS